MSTKKILNISVIVLLVLVNLPVYSYGQSGQGSQGTDTFKPVVITTEQLTATGKGTPAQPATPPPASFIPVTLTTEQLTATGKGTPAQPATPPPQSFQPVTINTGELSATGKGEAGTAPVPSQKVPPAKPLIGPIKK